MRKTVALPFAALALASVIAAGCSGAAFNGSNPAPTSTPFPVPSTPCTAPPNMGLQVVFPRDGDTAAPNVQGIVIAVAPSPLPTNWFFYASFQTSSQITFPTNIGFFSTPIPSPGPSGGPTSTPFPTPSDTPTFSPSFGPPIFESASIGKFATGSKFTIFLANSNCFPGVAYNTFTTSLTDSPTPTPTPAPTGT